MMFTTGNLNEIWMGDIAKLLKICVVIGEELGPIHFRVTQFGDMKEG